MNYEVLNISSENLVFPLLFDSIYDRIWSCKDKQEEFRIHASKSACIE